MKIYINSFHPLLNEWVNNSTFILSRKSLSICRSVSDISAWESDFFLLDISIMLHCPIRWHRVIMRCHTAGLPPQTSQQPIIAGAVASLEWVSRPYRGCTLIQKIQNNTELYRNCHTVIDENFAFLGTCDTERGWFSGTVILKVFFLPLDLEVLRPVERTCSSAVGTVLLEVSPGFPPTGIFVPETVWSLFSNKSQMRWAAFS